ncbi:MAG: DUF1501 domain-containing protein [Pseudomonadota bacterium]
MAFASAPTDERLVVIVLRGGMDGLAVLEPYGDRHLRKLRPTLASKNGEGVLDLDGFFGLHAGLETLMPLWRAGELAFVSSVSTPYRDKRSHFDGQDALESGSGERSGQPPSSHDGWLNRLISHMPGSTRETGMVLGRTNMLIMEGSNPTTTWAPQIRLRMDGANQDLLKVMYSDDPLFENALLGAMKMSENSDYSEQLRGRRRIASYAAKRLLDESRIVTFSIDGWDTHASQVTMLRKPLGYLTEMLLTMRKDLGDVWQKTTVVAVTEFGRTARENGTRGTDHGTGGAMLMAGGALNGGRVYGKWPGLQPEALYRDRDLMPTRDCRSYCAWLLRSKYGLDRTALERDIFPGVDMDDDPRLLG